MKAKTHKGLRKTSFRVIILGFAGVILIGTLLLMLPFASSNGVSAPLNEALFTATSAVCVTGLVVRDTASTWSHFGEAVILMLIQIGGLGVVTVGAVFAMISGKRITLMQRSTMQEALSAPKVGGIVKLTRLILLTTLSAEMVGACFMLPVFMEDFGVRGIWMAIFHSISAFCNAGFDLMGSPEREYVSLTAYYSNPLITLTICGLIIAGGIGFLTWRDFYKHRFHLRRYCLQSKVILATTFFLIPLPAILFFFLDFANLPLDQRLLCSLFQAVTPRTAGFNTANLMFMNGASKVVIIILMLIGGSPGSTAGGMKTTTIAVLIATTLASFMRKEDVQMFHRRLDPRIIRDASTILIMYLFLFIGGALIISVVENLPMGICFFETASAIGTVGLTLGITPQLGLVSQLILILLMFFGRVGGLTLIYATIAGFDKGLSRMPAEKITVG